MNIAQAKKISLESLLDKLGYQIVKIRKGGTDLWYRSPFRHENEPSFHIDSKNEKWFDFGEAEGGDIIDFVRKYEETNTAGALEFLGNIEGMEKRQNIQHEIVNNGNPFVLINEKSIKHPALINYLEERKIPLELAKKYLLEIHFKNVETDKLFFGLGLKNEAGGFEIRNKFAKNNTGSKDLSYLRASGEPESEIDIFEGMFDFLSFMVLKSIENLKNDVIILNSLSFFEKAIKIINEKGYKKVNTWLDNNKPAEKITNLFKEELSCQISDQNDLYIDFDDLNEYLKNCQP